MKSDIINLSHHPYLNSGSITKDEIYFRNDHLADKVKK